MKLPVILNLTISVTGVLFSGLLGAATSSTPLANSGSALVERNIPASLATLMCERAATGGDFIKNGLFDAQVEVLSLQTNNNSVVITIDQARERAKKLAVTKQQLGYAYGLCRNGGAWVAAFPSPAAITVEKDQLKIPGSMKQICIDGTLKVSFAPEERGRSLALTVQENMTAFLPNQRGYASLSCTPKMHPESGPREWALIPVAGANIDAKEVGAPNGRDPKSVFEWVNQKRRQENLPGLDLDKPLSDAATSLLAMKDIRHNIKALASARDNLMTRGIVALGEDRVRGRDLNELVGLIWMSPQHRDLVLNPAADSVGIAISYDPEGMFAVILAGKKLPGSVAKKIDVK